MSHNTIEEKKSKSSHHLTEIFLPSPVNRFSSHLFYVPIFSPLNIDRYDYGIKRCFVFVVCIVVIYWSLFESSKDSSVIRISSNFESNFVKCNKIRMATTHRRTNHVSGVSCLYSWITSFINRCASVSSTTNDYSVSIGRQDRRKKGQF